MRVHVLRLLPGDDLIQSLQNFAIERDIDAAVVLTCTGTMCVTTLRPSGEFSSIVLEGVYGEPSATHTTPTAGCAPSHFDTPLAAIGAARPVTRFDTPLGRRRGLRALRAAVEARLRSSPPDGVRLQVRDVRRVRAARLHDQELVRGCHRRARHGETARRARRGAGGARGARVRVRCAWGRSGEERAFIGCSAGRRVGRSARGCLAGSGGGGWGGVCRRCAPSCFSPPQVAFIRSYDERTGSNELMIVPAGPGGSRRPRFFPGQGLEAFDGRQHRADELVDYICPVCCAEGTTSIDRSTSKLQVRNDHKHCVRLGSSGRPGTWTVKEGVFQFRGVGRPRCKTCATDGDPTSICLHPVSVRRRPVRSRPRPSSPQPP